MRHWTTQGNTKDIIGFPPKPTPATYAQLYLENSRRMHGMQPTKIYAFVVNTVLVYKEYF